MKYVIEKNNKNDMKLMYYNVKMVGLRVNPANKAPGLTIKAKEIVLIDPELRDSYIKQKINRKIDKVVNFMIHILNDEGTSDDDAGMVLDELNRLKGIITKKYKEYMVESEYKALMTKFFIIEEEFKKNYSQKMYMNYLSGSMYQEDMSSYRGR